MDDAIDSIRIASEKTGLSPHVIRIWERRYNAVTPERTATNRRLYGPAEIERLSLLRVVTEAGHNIGTMARLSTDQLRKIAGERLATVLEAKAPAAGPPLWAIQFQEDALKAIREFDAFKLNTALKKASVVVGHQGVLQKVIAPVIHKIGELWFAGELTAAHEHFASAAIRLFVAESARPFAEQSDAAAIVVATPSGQLHELGAVLVAAAAASLGWRVVFLGSALPSAEIAGAAISNRARVVALSIVYPEDDPHLPDELERLRDILPGDTSVLIGGRAADAYADVLEKIGAVRCRDLDDFHGKLEQARRVNLRAAAPPKA